MKRLPETCVTLQFRLWALPKTQEGTTEHLYNQEKDVCISIKVVLAAVW